MEETNLRHLARKGAEIRLKEIREEIEAVHEFIGDPEKLALQQSQLQEKETGEKRTGRTRKKKNRLSAEARQAISKRMTKYWAERRAWKNSSRSLR